jgi:hypothetical protein
MSGVTVGHGAVIGAQAVVAKNVPPYAIVAGNPARLLRLRFSEEHIRRLLAVAWWDWSEEAVLAAAPRLLSGDIEAFLVWAERSRGNPDEHDGLAHVANSLEFGEDR